MEKKSFQKGIPIKAHNANQKAIQAKKQTVAKQVVQQHAVQPAVQKTTQTVQHKTVSPNKPVNNVIHNVDNIKTNTAMLAPIQQEQIDSIIELNL